MAKFILPSNRYGVTRRVPCAVIDEDRLNETYTVRFTNGSIRTVKKNRVANLDRIDEALIDTLRSGASAVKRGVSKIKRKVREFVDAIYNTVVYTGKCIYTAVAGVATSHLGNTMLAAADEDNNFLGFIPSNSVAKECEEAGIEATQTFNDVEDPELYDDINNFWYAVMNGDIDVDNNAANESLRYGRKSRKSRRIYEASNPDIEPVDGSAGHPIVNRKEAETIVASAYITRRDGIQTEDSPALFWGAPGIGKTQIMTGMAKKLSEKFGGNINVITINALGFRKDSFSIPNFETIEQTFYTENGESYDIPVRIPKDYTKSWLPTYDPQKADKMVQESRKLGQPITREEAIAILDNIANGGHPANPETGEEYVEGQGGIIFIDEVSRIAREVMNVFMKFMQDRELNGEILGSRWIFAAASNRATDMSSRASQETKQSWERAWSERFTHYNFVPTVEEWLDWGSEEVEIDGKMMTRLDPDVMEYVRTNPAMFYNVASSNQDAGDFTVKDLIPNPRAWKQFTDSKRALIRTAEKFGEKPSEDLIKKSLQGKIGAKAANQYYEWLVGPAKNFTSQMAQAVWEQGPNVLVNGNKIKTFNSSQFLTSPGGVIDILFANHPDVVANKPMKDRRLTPEQWENCAKYIAKCLRTIKTDKTATGTAPSIIQNVLTHTYDCVGRIFGDKFKNCLLQPDIYLQVYNTDEYPYQAGYNILLGVGEDSANDYRMDTYDDETDNDPYFNK